MIYIPSMKDSDGAGVISAIAAASGSFNYTTLNSTATEGNTKDAINTFVIRLKNAGIWEKIGGLWGYVGANAASHAINWKTLSSGTWNGTLTHSTGGTTGDGSTGYLNTGILATSVGSSTSGWMAVYSRTVSSSTADLVELGSEGAGSTYYGNTLKVGGSANPAGRSCNIGGTRGTESAYYSSDDSSGLFLGSRTSSTLITLYRNGVSKATYTSTVSSPASINVFVHATNGNGSVCFCSNRQLCLAVLGASGTSLSSAESDTFNTIVQELQTRLGRNV